MERLAFFFTRAILLAALVFIASMSLGAVESNQAVAAQTPECVPGAAIVQSANALGWNELFGVEGVSRADVWAVGSYFTPTTGTHLPLLAHWNGMGWSQVANPDYGNNNVGRLNAVAALSANDVWAVGNVYNRAGGSSSRTLIQRWDGSRWNVVPSPNPGERSGPSLNAVYARSSNDAWAVGSYAESGSIRTLTMHWDGSQWTIVPNPTPTFGTGGILHSVGGVAANDIWAVGELVGSQYGNFFILHWDGTQWSQVTADGFGILRGVEAIATNDVWAVGYQTYGEGITIHWNGVQWSAVPIPNPKPTVQIRLYGVTALSPTNVWAVGTISNNPYTSEYRYNDSYVQRWDGVRWSVVEDAVAGSSKLFGVAGVEGEIWAVGGFDTPQTLAEKWDGSRWSVASTPNPGRAHNSLIAMDVLAPDNIWAVGQYDFYYPYGGGGSNTRPLIQHWDGTRWSNVPVPYPSSLETLMDDIKAISANDIWAVGKTGSGGSFFTYTLHWDGREWTQIPSPNANESPHYLEAVDGTAWNNVWAVGFIFGQYPGQSDQTFIMHWNGLAWNIIPSPNVEGASNQIQDIEVLSLNSAWAVGNYSTVEWNPLILRWNGAVWSRVPVSGIGSSVTLSSVSALSENDIWAVGSERVGGVARTLTIHWNGAQWSRVPSPNFGTSNNYIGSVKAIAPDDVWAVGSFQGGTLMLHWNGTEWSIRTITTPGQLFNGLADVDASGPQDVWAVGGYSSGGPGDTLVQHVGRFSDVSPTDFYYAPVNSLVGRGAIGGYDDCTFRPQNNVTRGQVSKVVALAEGWALANPSQATFADVPRGFTFYRYVETLFARGVLGGYPCGGPGEPCDAQRRPYFRPNADITRAQIAKVVVLARRWALTNPPNATFADVPPGSAFYAYVETALAHGVLSGYPCGGPGEPCDPQRRPVFRPQNNATRGQVAKIIYNAVTQP